MSSMDLVEFLTARLDEDERWARAASIRGEGAPEHWQWVSADTDEPVPLDDLGDVFGVGLRSVETYPTSVAGMGPLPSFVIETVTDSTGAMPHIARHDPARVLAEVEAKRAVLDLLETAEQHVVEVRRTAADYVYVQRAEVPRDALLRAVQALAMPYADHPDYREEWRP